MKHLNAKASKIIQKIYDSINDPKYAKTVGSYAKINNRDGIYMPISVEKIGNITGMGEEIAISHTYVQNGDLMRDPEMTFAIKEGKFYPLTFRQDNMGISQEVIAQYSDDGAPMRYRKNLQRDLVEFANMWMLNINQQQQLGVAV